jgi:LacI family transcriptional regulator, gluconate utilization system Gnt-I transcriptional repressor
MTQALLGDGHRHIAFAAAKLDPRTLQRADGYRRAMRDAGRPPREWLDPDRSSLALGGRLFERILLEAPEIDAIFFNNDDLAQGALLAALRLGVHVPAEVAVAGFNDLTGSEQMLPPLTTVRTPRSAIGREAATMLMALMRGEIVPQPRLDLGFEIVRRASS